MRKTFILFIFIILFQSGFAQETEISAKIANHIFPIKDCNDFSYLDKLLKNKRVVVLGESNHQDGTSFEIKVKLVKYMVEKLGFDVVGLERLDFAEGQLFPNHWQQISPQIKQKFDFKELYLNEINLNKFDIANLWLPLWANTNECQPLVDAINQNQISAFGFDYFANILSVESFQILLNSFSKDYLTTIDFPKFEAFYIETLIRHSLEAPCKEMSVDEHLKFLETLMTIKNIAQKELLIGRNRKNAEILLQAVKNTEVLHRGYLLAQKKYISADDRLTYGNNFRDQQMADNVIWYLDLNPKKKIIIWCANLHGVRNFTQAERLWPSFLMYSETKFMGEYLFEKYGDQFYSLAFTSSEWGTGDKADETSLEYHIAAKGIDYGFIDFTPLRYQDEYFNKTFQAYILMRNRAKWLNMFDGIYFIRHQKQSTFIKK